MSQKFAARTALVATCLGLALSSGCRQRQADAPPDRRPNILVILLDDLRWDALGYAGHRAVRTPQIDRIEVLWPSGKRQTLAGKIPVHTLFTITEDR